VDRQDRREQQHQRHEPETRQQVGVGDHRERGPLGQPLDEHVEEPEQDRRAADADDDGDDPDQDLLVGVPLRPQAEGQEQRPHHVAGHAHADEPDEDLLGAGLAVDIGLADL
jgi:hypothetical protein